MSKTPDISKHNAILADISSGMSVRKACEKHGVNHWTFMQAVDASHYARAREAQADVHFDEMAELEELCLAGELNPQALRVLLDSRKWRLARMKPKSYGDKVELEHKGAEGGASGPVIDLSHLSADDLIKLTRFVFRDDAAAPQEGSQ